MAVTLTDAQIISKLGTDPIFGLEFIVQNQPDKVRDKLKQFGFNTIGTQIADFESLKNLLQVNPAKVGEILNNIPYDNAAPNWTGGLETEFGVASTQAQSTRSIWGGILTGVGALLGAIGGSIGGSSTGTGTTLTPEQIALMKQQEEARLKAEREARNRNILIGVIGFVLLIIITALIVSSGKKKAAAAAAAK